MPFGVEIKRQIFALFTVYSQGTMHALLVLLQIKLGSFVSQHNFGQFVNHKRVLDNFLLTIYVFFFLGGGGFPLKCIEEYTT